MEQTLGARAPWQSGRREGFIDFGGNVRCSRSSPSQCTLPSALLFEIPTNGRGDDGRFNGTKETQSEHLLRIATVSRFPCDSAGHAQARHGGVESNVGANAPSLQLVRAREARIQHYVVSPTWRKRRRRRRRRLDLYPLFRYTLRRPGGREETSGSGGAD